MATSPNEPPGQQDQSDNSPVDQKKAATEEGNVGSGTGLLQSILKTFGQRRVGSTEETTNKRSFSSLLSGIIQLGITHTLGSMCHSANRDVLMQDFEVIQSFYFPSKGNNLTPAHNFGDFKFKVYAPVAFRYFREMFGIQPREYMYSLCHESLIHWPNPGASGSMFFLSCDDTYIIKTVQNTEAEFLQKLLPGYFMNLNQNKHTLLPKFYGLYCLHLSSKEIHLVVMNNLLPSSVQMEVIFDLKGSTLFRQASAKERQKPVPTLKDLDFIDTMRGGLMLESDKYNALSKTIQRDCLLLQSFRIMDYSLLVAIHNIDKSRESASEAAVSVAADQKKCPATKSLYNTCLQSIQYDSDSELSADPEESTGGIPAQSPTGDKLLLYIGIIDILQSYRFSKKLEHSWKAMVHDSDTISVHRPSFYADRFQMFMCSTVFRRMPCDHKYKHCPGKKPRASGLTKKNICPGTSAPDQSNKNHERPLHKQENDTKGTTAANTVLQSGQPDPLSHNSLSSNPIASTSQISQPTNLANVYESDLSRPK